MAEGRHRLQHDTPEPHKNLPQVPRASAHRQMSEHPGPFYIFEIAQKLARQPGRLEFDRDEAHRIADDIYDWYRRGEFGEQEIVAQYGDPPCFGPLARAEDEAKQRGQEWEDISFGLWYAAIALTWAAAKRYIAGCGLAGAARLLSEWFGATNGLKQTGKERPSDQELDCWMMENVRPGSSKYQSIITDCCSATGATVRAAKAALNRLPEQIRRKRGRPPLRGKIDP